MNLNPKPRVKTVDCYIRVGIKFVTKKRLDALGFNLNMARGKLIDLIVGSVPPRITKKMKPEQRKMLKLALIRKGKKLYRDSLPQGK